MVAEQHYHTKNLDEEDIVKRYYDFIFFFFLHFFLFQSVFEENHAISATKNVLLNPHDIPTD